MSEENIAFKSFYYSLGTTSFRMRNFNQKIEQQLDLLNQFWQKSEYANRIAHLYFLRVLNGINAYLVNIYFINDNSVAGPKSIDEWRGALTIIKHYLGIPKKNKLENYMIDIFIDVNDLIK